MNAHRLVISTQDWVKRIREGDHAAFEAAFRAYYAELCAFAYRYLRSPALAEEVVHDVFARLWQIRSELQIRSSVKAYLYGAVRHRAISLLRRHTVEEAWQADTALEDYTREVHGRNAGPEQLEREQLVAAVEHVLAGLPPRCRMAVILRWQREMSYAEIAETMQISVKTVEAHLTRATKELRLHLPALLPDLTQD